jgi:aconitate hydratase
MSTIAKLTVDDVAYDVIDLPAEVGHQLGSLPYIHRILLENILRTAGEDAARAKAAMLDWLATGSSELEIPFLPSRVMMHDTTCGPALVDTALSRLMSPRTTPWLSMPLAARRRWRST